MGRRRRRAARESSVRVAAFSSAKSSSRSRCHSCAETISGRGVPFMVTGYVLLVTHPTGAFTCTTNQRPAYRQPPQTIWAGSQDRGSAAQAPTRCREATELHLVVAPAPSYGRSHGRG